MFRVVSSQSSSQPARDSDEGTRHRSCPPHKTAARVFSGIAVILVVTSGCGATRATNGTGQSFSGCGTLTTDVEARLETAARSNFVITQGSHISRFQIRSATTFPIPSNLRRFGITTIVQVWGTTWLSDATSDGLSGVDVAAGFVMNDDGSKIYPFGESGKTLFKLPVAQGDMAVWIDHLYDGSTNDSALGCPHS